MTAVMSHSIHTQTDYEFMNDHMLRRDTRVYLECPYHEKDLVKELGARWDTTQRRWYASPGINLEPLAPWMKERIYLRCDNIDDQGTIENVGAKYDTTLCQYYILDDVDKEPCTRWFP